VPTLNARRTAQLVLKRNADRRLRAGHPWIYRGEIHDLRGDWSPGHAVDVVDAGGRLLGRGFYNLRTSLACRLITRGDERVDAALFGRRLAAALARRGTPEGADGAYRLCWSEADGLPGLVVDRYGPVSVVQCLTLGMARAIAWIEEALHALFPGAPIYRADDATSARIEGFDPVRGWLGDPGPDEVIVTEGRSRFVVTPGSGHKTGFYLDQRDNRRLVAEHAEGRRVLDAFCYTGAFACHALAAGAASAQLVDASTDALAIARRNLELNGLADRAELCADNAFDVLRQLDAQGERFGVVILDPPPFTRTKDAVAAAARGYKEINLRGLRLLEPGGVLATFSCSHHVTREMFEGICREAAGDAGVGARVLATLAQSTDHPVLLAIPETRYLTGLLLQAT
jgi:23S rRNA (cytosine1962-C5)-methyltransferase